jgi:hypothetical protein
MKSAPVVEKGVSTIYGTLSSGFDLGVKGAKNVVGKVKKITKGGKTRKLMHNNSQYKKYKWIC